MSSRERTKERQLYMQNKITESKDQCYPAKLSKRVNRQHRLQQKIEVVKISFANKVGKETTAQTRSSTSEAILASCIF